MHRIKSFIKKYFGSFVFFFRYLKYKIFVALILSILVGILDGFGLSMFMPLLQMAGGEGEVNPESLGNLQFLLDITESVGISLDLTVVLLLMCGFFILKGIVMFLNGSYLVVLLLKFIRKMRIDIVDGITNMSYKSFVFSDVGRIQNTASSEIGRVSKAYKAYFGAFEQFVLVMVYIGFAFVVDPQFAVLVTIGGATTNLLYSRIYKITKKTSKAVTDDSHVFQGLLIQFVSSLKYLKATGFLKDYSKKVKQVILYIEGGNKKIGLWNAMLVAAREPLLIIVVTIVIMVQIKVFEAALGPILLSLIFFYRALSALMVMQTQYNSFMAMSGSMVNMTAFLDELAQSAEKQKGDEAFTKLEDGIELKDAYFRYAEDDILKNINLKIKKNETIAIVGESGSGKSTIVSLIAGLMPLNSGELLVDSTDIQSLNKKSFQKRIGYITQEAVIFSDTIFNNVTLWAEKTEENINRFNNALEKAAIKDFIYEQKEGEDALLGNNGVNLSGGQKQRISIARELYKDIDILIMDEATSALDSETEKNIQKNIDQLKGRYTILIVAHRLSTVKNADRIILMKKGEIEAIDAYKDLLNSSAAFQQMVNLQEL